VPAWPLPNQPGRENRHHATFHQQGSGHARWPILSLSLRLSNGRSYGGPSYESDQGSERSRCLQSVALANSEAQQNRVPGHIGGQNMVEAQVTDRIHATGRPREQE